MKMCDPSQQTFWPETESASMSSREASRAKTLAWQEGAPVSTANAPASGLRLCDSLASYDRDTLSWRTSQTCLVALLENEADGLAEFSETWPSAGMMRSGKTYRLRPWALSTCESAHGLWPTPNKSNGFAPFSRETMLRKERGEARPSGCRMGFDLKWERRCLPYLVDGWINPILTEWLMGFPIGHTDLLPAATPSSRKSPNS